MKWIINAYKHANALVWISTFIFQYIFLPQQIAWKNHEERNVQVAKTISIDWNWSKDASINSAISFRIHSMKIQWKQLLNIRLQFFYVFFTFSIIQNKNTPIKRLKSDFEWVKKRIFPTYCIYIFQSCLFVSWVI